MQIAVFFKWFDCWIGAYWDKGGKTLYICPIPMFVIRIRFQNHGKSEREIDLALDAHGAGQLSEREYTLQFLLAQGADELALSIKNQEHIDDKWKSID